MITKMIRISAGLGFPAGMGTNVEHGDFSRKCMSIKDIRTPAYIRQFIVNDSVTINIFFKGAVSKSFRIISVKVFRFRWKLAPSAKDGNSKTTFQRTRFT